jgi:hypothetical protein
VKCESAAVFSLLSSESVRTPAHRVLRIGLTSTAFPDFVEYRNEFFVDTGVLVLREPPEAAREHSVGLRSSSKGVR